MTSHEVKVIDEWVMVAVLLAGRLVGSGAAESVATETGSDEHKDDTDHERTTHGAEDDGDHSPRTHDRVESDHTLEVR